MMQRVVLGAVVFLELMGCSAAQHSPEKNPVMVWMQKPDGSKMCGFEKGDDPTEVATHLKNLGISVAQARRGDDGQMHMMVCGGFTGKTIDVLVPSSEVEATKQQGFDRKRQP